MKVKFLLLVSIMISMYYTTSAQLKLTSNNHLQIGADIYTPIMIGPGQNGKWAIEYWEEYGGLNFWIPSPNPSQGDGNGKLFIQDNTGYVGINTYTPHERLEIGGSLRGNLSRGGLQLKTDDGNIQFGPFGTGYAHIYTDRPCFAFNKIIVPITGQFGAFDQSDLTFTTGYRYDNPGIVRMVIQKSNGYVGIGRTPWYNLDINGSLRVYLTVYNSDERLKENIKDMTSSLSSLTRLRGVTYRLKPKGMASASSLQSTSAAKADTGAISTPPQELDTVLYNRSHIGFLAQEVRKVFPELVYEDKEGMLSVDYVSLIPVLVESIKELNNRTSDYSKALNDLQETKNKLAELGKKLETCCSNSKLKSAQAVADVQTNAILYQNIPNPFTQNTEIRYFLPENVQSASLYIFNMQGTQIKSIPIHDRGAGSVIINGSELNAGMYLYSLIADNKEIDTKRMILTQ